MSAPCKGTSGPLWFCYADPTGFSGQRAATELVIRGMEARGLTCRRLGLPLLEREVGGPGPVLRYAWRVTSTWIRSLGMLFGRKGWLCVNIGQTRSALLRDSVPLLAGWLAFGRARLVVSLHSSLFMGWKQRSMDAALFRFLLGRAGLVTVLGERQKSRLVELGIPPSRIRIVVNTCSLGPLTEGEMASKLDRGRLEGRPLQVLHLSSLIDTKGFPEYLEALEILSPTVGHAIDAVLCGPLTASDFSERFPSACAAAEWINGKIAATNAGTRVRVRWVNGASGEAKRSLFLAADIFVMPTRYRVEAQPLVLLEAMASACAIVTTRIGEIPTILDETCAVLMENVSGIALAEVLDRMAADRGARERLAAAGRARFIEKYSVEKHIDLWEGIVAGMGAVRSER